jgi:hypothetical protein
MVDFDVFLQVICAAGGQHEEHTEYGSPVMDVVNKKQYRTAGSTAYIAILYSLGYSLICLSILYF